MQIEAVTEAQYRRLVEGGEPLERMRSGVKVWRLPDGHIVKLFRPRGLLSRSGLQPPSLRFAGNAQRLRTLGFNSVAVERCFRIVPAGAHGVVYAELPGTSLEAALTAGPDAALLAALGSLSARLHDAGVLFRALHLGNVIVGPAGTLGLIDVEVLTIRARPLTMAGRCRNFGHLLRRPCDRRLLRGLGIRIVLDAYLQESILTGDQARHLREHAQRLLARPD